jgi:GNAT superfamily N-acetyltransferase
VPTIRLARLAVDSRFRGKGLGADLLVHALRTALRASTQVGAFAVEVDAKDAAAVAFYIHHGFTGLEDDSRHLYLSIRTARKALGG